jgi:asparagine synthase (glutamine-hydrolysing)
MCGVVGFIGGGDKIDISNVLSVMSETLEHRGPNGSGKWIDKERGIAIAHRRLSIIELSPDGDQPMVSVDNRYVISFNGEIYNYKQLYNELSKEGIIFNGSSDTRVLLTCIQTWGIDKTISKIIGMFAFSLWDQRKKELILVRDRMGIKPLYYGWSGSDFVFSSELKAICKHPMFLKIIDRKSFEFYSRYSCIQSPRSIYENIFSLAPGNILKISLEDVKNRVINSPKSYWSLSEVCISGKNNQIHDRNEAINLLEGVIKTSVKDRMVSDVSLGAFLSGGIDSSLVVALMQAQSEKPIKTFSIGFDDDRYNESNYAEIVAKHLNTDHETLNVSPKNAIDSIYKMPELFDEPFADSSQIPTYLVSSMASKSVTVALSGDGGDELFGGYNRYYWADNIWDKSQKIPYFLRLKFSTLFKAIPPSRWDSIYNNIYKFLPNKYQYSLPGEKMHKVANVISSRDIAEVYNRLVSQFIDKDSHKGKFNVFQDINGLTNSEAMMLSDQKFYLPSDILTKVDRASMGASIEARVPLLDHRVAELSWRMPLSSKINNKQGKWALRKILYKYIPQDLVERPKMGFSVPLDEWLREGLRDWSEELLSEKKLKEDGFFNADHVRKMWDDHLRKKSNNQHSLWTILMFQAWQDRWKGS